MKKKYKLNLSEDFSIERKPPLKDNDIVKVIPIALQKISTGLIAIAKPISPILTSLSLLK